MIVTADTNLVFICICSKLLNFYQKSINMYIYNYILCRINRKILRICINNFYIKLYNVIYI